MTWDLFIVLVALYIAIYHLGYNNGVIKGISSHDSRTKNT